MRRAVLGLATALLAGCVAGRDSASCDEYAWQPDDEANQAPQVQFLERVVFDTTASELSLHAYDAKTTGVIGDVTVLVQAGALQVQDTTNDYGTCSIMRNGLSGTGWLLLRAPGYRCLEITGLRLGGGLRLQVALQPDGR